ncbi:hypothetical protein Aspvir_006961 [Aspergillus viridinutans]|uniref:HNH nuclease domain-containing protein n=1 Tax=Aspergillus viridinutans TaxID=75553 RepID=A0A9P3BYF3_ASPVI|nr:uncharacterized protein Aspvir_006961 [Aspergillus viridinutans]GIK02898.1 hypothetical protein Aspvir_006961 [Aspergillus viridinutans]
MPPTSPNRGRQRDPVSPRRSRRLAGQTPEVDTRGARAQQRSASKANCRQSVNGMPEPTETFTNLIDAARARVESYVNGERPHEEYLRPCLKAFLEWLPPGGQTSVARDIVNAGNDDQKLWQVFHDLLTCLLYRMMAESPIPSERESPFDFREPNLEVFVGTLIQPEVRDSDFRDECARRDDYRCCITGHLGTTKWKHNGYLPVDEDVECADIIPCSYTSWAGSEWEVFYKCFPRVCRSRLKTPSNGMMLLDFLHKSFRMFDMAFVKTEEQNVYDIKICTRFNAVLKMLLPPDDRKVKFQCSEGADNIPLPDPMFLDCHYRVAEIINAADLVWPIRNKIRDWRDLEKYGDTNGCLRSDGSTDITDILNTALWPAVAE